MAVRRHGSRARVTWAGNATGRKAAQAVGWPTGREANAEGSRTRTVRFGERSGETGYESPRQLGSRFGRELLVRNLTPWAWNVGSLRQCGPRHHTGSREPKPHGREWPKHVTGLEEVQTVKVVGNGEGGPKRVWKPATRHRQTKLLM
jgi:hypothetical protein